MKPRASHRFAGLVMSGFWMLPGFALAEDARMVFGPVPAPVIGQDLPVEIEEEGGIKPKDIRPKSNEQRFSKTG